MAMTKIFFAVFYAVCVTIANSDMGLPMTGDDSDPLEMRSYFPAANENLLNDQINRELDASYLYEAMASYFARPRVALNGFSKFFKKSADEEREHSRKIIDYVNLRGGKVVLKTILRPTSQEWNSPMDALKAAFQKEKELNVKIMDLRNSADLAKDYHLVSFLEDVFLTEQVESIKTFREMIAKLERAGSGVGEYLFDKDLL